MNLILFDDHLWDDLLPLTFTRPISGIRIGILTLKEKWEKITGITVSNISKTYLKKAFPVKINNNNILINSCLLPDQEIADHILSCPENTAYEFEGRLIYANLNNLEVEEYINSSKLNCTKKQLTAMPDYIDRKSVV